MKYIKQLGIILFLSFIGEILHALIPLPIPASIYGIILMFICLTKQWIPLNEVKATGDFLIEIMPLMFIPATVGLMDSWSLIAPTWVAYVVISVVSTVLVMIVAGSVTQYIIRKEKKEASYDE